MLCSGHVENNMGEYIMPNIIVNHPRTVTSLDFTLIDKMSIHHGVIHLTDDEGNYHEFKFDEIEYIRGDEHETILDVIER